MSVLWGTAFETKRKKKKKTSHNSPFDLFFVPQCTFFFSSQISFFFFFQWVPFVLQTKWSDEKLFEIPLCWKNCFSLKMNNIPQFWMLIFSWWTFSVSDLTWFCRWVNAIYVVPLQNVCLTLECFSYALRKQKQSRKTGIAKYWLFWFLSFNFLWGGAGGCFVFEMAMPIFNSKIPL